MKKEKNIGYKAMNDDMTCKDYHYEVGKTYEIEEGTELKICENGFHFCFDAVDCLRFYYNVMNDRRFFKIQYDDIVIDGIKGCTNKITILEEINILDYIRENKDTVDWKWVSAFQKLSEDFIREFKDKIYWRYSSGCQILSEDFIIEFQDCVDWRYISQYQKLSESFIREFQDKVEWDEISSCQILSQSFIREFQDKVNWYKLSKYQKLSENFIREFQDKVDWVEIYCWQELSDKFKEEFEHKYIDMLIK